MYKKSAVRHCKKYVIQVDIFIMTSILMMKRLLKRISHKIVLKVLRALKVKLTDLDSWSAERIHMVIKAVADDLDLKLGKVAPALRLAVTGQGVSPPINVTLELLGSDKSLHRIDQAIDYVVGSV